MLRRFLELPKLWKQIREDKKKEKEEEKGEFLNVMKEKQIYSRKELEEKRTEAFDRWTWETGSEEDRLEFEACDEALENAEMAEMIARSKVILLRHMKDDFKDNDVAAQLADELEKRAKKKLKIIEDFNK